MMPDTSLSLGYGLFYPIRDDCPSKNSSIQYFSSSQSESYGIVYKWEDKKSFIGFKFINQSYVF